MVDIAFPSLSDIIRLSPSPSLSTVQQQQLQEREKERPDNLTEFSVWTKSFSSSVWGDAQVLLMFLSPLFEGWKKEPGPRVPPLDTEVIGPFGGKQVSMAHDYRTLDSFFKWGEGLLFPPFWYTLDVFLPSLFVILFINYFNEQEPIEELLTMLILLSIFLCLFFTDSTSGAERDASTGKP